MFEGLPPFRSWIQIGTNANCTLGELCFTDLTVRLWKPNNDLEKSLRIPLSRARACGRLYTLLKSQPSLSLPYRGLINKLESDCFLASFVALQRYLLIAWKKTPFPMSVHDLIFSAYLSFSSSEADGGGLPEGPARLMSISCMASMLLPTTWPFP
jgi:hypothetical protein